MKTSKGVRIAKMWDELEEKDNWDEFEKYLKNCSESDLREACRDNKNMLINICFSFYCDPGFEYVSEDFIKQMFIDLQKDDKDYLQKKVWQQIYGIGTDIYNDNRNTLMYIAANSNWLFKVGHYIKYCNPENEKLIGQYRYVMSQACLHMNIDKIFE